MVVSYDDMWLMDPQSGRTEKVRTALEDLSCYSKVSCTATVVCQTLFNDRILGTHWLCGSF